MVFKHPVQRRINAFGIITQITEAAANEGELRLCRSNVFYLADSFNGFMLHDITAQSVNSIGWVNNNAAIFQAFCHLFN